MKQLLSDLELETKVKDLLRKMKGVDATDLTVTSQDGTITLAGTVKEDRQKFALVSLVQKIPEVRAIQNEIVVKINEGILPTDVGRDDDSEMRA